MKPELIAERYRVIRAAGRGGMGTVWLCRDEVLDRDVAVKQIEGLPGESAAAAARPLREARLSAALNHESAVSIYDIVDHAGSTWLVLEYVPSGTLKEVIQQEQRLSVPRVTRIAAQLASALATAHSLGIIHRDVKPGNVLIGENDLAKITDFGIARGHQDEQLTLTGFVTGTPSYFSPELARGGDPGPASDVWALGATLYAAVEGAPPYGEGGNPLALLGRIASEPPPPPTHAGTLTGTLSSMLDPNPTTRASMEAVLSDLIRLAGPEDADVARARERNRAYADTTLHDQPVGVLGAMLQPTQVTPPPERTTIEGAGGSGSARALPATEPPPDERGTRRPSLALVTVGLATALVVLIAGALLWSSITSPANDGSSAAGTDGTAGTAGGPVRQSSGTSTGIERTSSGASGPGPTTATSPLSPSSAAPSTTATTPVSRPPPKDSAMAAFVTSYFHTLPDDTNSGWKQLAPSMRTVGRTSYETFWGSINSVDVTGVHAVGAQAVEYEITYHFDDARVVLERQRIDLAPHGKSFWITADTVLSSRTISP